MSQLQNHAQLQGINRTAAPGRVDGVGEFGVNTAQNLPDNTDTSVICFLQSASRICAGDAAKSATDGSPSCLFAHLIGNGQCGPMEIDRGNGSGSFLLNGMYCEFHSHALLNMATRVKMTDSRVEIVPLAVSSLKRNTLMYPLLCAQPLNSGIEHFRQVFSETVRPVSEIENLSKFFATACRSLRSNFAPSIYDKNAMREMVNIGNGFSPSLSKLLTGCWQHDTVNLYFTKEYLSANNRHAWIQAALRHKIDGSSDDVVTLRVPINLLTAHDILIVKSFRASRKQTSDGVIINSRMPNVQIFNGNFYYSMGWGVNYGLPDKYVRYSLEGLPYDKNTLEIVSQRKNVANFTELIIDATSTTDQHHIVKFPGFCINPCSQLTYNP
ncbi:hypothetical protein DOLIC_00144 [Dolichomitus sp. PSUC_FEM 10030005]|nr:hypothetical protein [Dolichomitus sp. PSUC_FEM 10030005]